MEDSSWLLHKLHGERVHARFGTEFPINFDFLDTMRLQNLSLQVHPLKEYIQENFGMHYTQDESYYMHDAVQDACVYLGLKEDIKREDFLNDLKRAENGEITFPDEKYIFTFKLWDWNRVGLDGLPRPIHINYREKVVQLNRTTNWVRANLVNQKQPVSKGDGWEEERTRLHEREFIETSRHWFSTLSTLYFA